MSNRPPSVLAARRREARTPNVIVGAAALITRTTSAKATETASWQSEVWARYDAVGEYRFGVGWIANGLSRVNLVAALPPTNTSEEPKVINLEESPEYADVVEAVAAIAGGVEGHGSLLHDLAIQLTVPGVGYIWTTADDSDSFSDWRVLSNEEVKPENGVIMVRHRNEDGSDAGFKPLDEAKDLLIKVWNPHPRESWKPDSPSRAVRAALDQIDLFDAHIIATGDSQIAGNGLLILPTEMEFPPHQGVNRTNPDGSDRTGDDDFIQTLMMTMEIGRGEPGSTVGRTPLIIKVPGDLIEKVQHMTFGTPFDEQVERLREAAIKRLALGLDMPPEILLGMGEANHWSAWQITEEAITLQIEPMAERICHALTKFYLRRALAELGRDEKSVIVWYDTTELRTRPDLGPAASEAHDKGLLSDDAYLREKGLNPDDKPSEEEFARRILLDAARADPVRLAIPVLSALGLLPTALETLALPAPTEVIDVVEPGQEDAPVDETRAIPERSEEETASAAPVDVAVLVAAADGVVFRALEKAGMRQRGAMARAQRVDQSAIPCTDPATFHVENPATAHVSIDYLLAGAWDRVPHLASRYHVSPDALEAALSSYTSALLAAGIEHSEDRLAEALGALAAA